jgi:hypothetical protein
MFVSAKAKCRMKSAAQSMPTTDAQVFFADCLNAAGGLPKFRIRLALLTPLVQPGRIQVRLPCARVRSLGGRKRDGGGWTVGIRPHRLGLSFNLYRLKHRYFSLRMSTEPNNF